VSRAPQFIFGCVIITTEGRYLQSVGFISPLSVGCLGYTRGGFDINQTILKVPALLLNVDGGPNAGVLTTTRAKPNAGRNAQDDQAIPKPRWNPTTWIGSPALDRAPKMPPARRQCHNDRCQIMEECLPGSALFFSFNFVMYLSPNSRSSPSLRKMYLFMCDHHEFGQRSMSQDMRIWLDYLTGYQYGIPGPELLDIGVSSKGYAGVF